MRLFDDKDVRIVAQAIESVGPDSVAQCADLIVEAAMQAMVFPNDLIAAIQRRQS